MKKLIILITFIPVIAFSKSYQVGSKWSKKYISKADASFQVLKKSVGEVGSRATVFYVGQKNGKHLGITNYHVCPKLESTPLLNKNHCDGQGVSFFYVQNKRGKSLRGVIKNVPVAMKSLDLSIVEISFTDSHEFESKPTPLKLSSEKPYMGQELISVGYGSYNNEYGVLMIEEDSFECQVFSKDLRLVSDPDTYNPVGYKVNSFLHGCDVSHGDSGSPILDRNTMEVVGLLWTGKYPKADSISQDGFHQLPIEFLWSELNYASPGHLIQEALEQLE